VENPAYVQLMSQLRHTCKNHRYQLIVVENTRYPEHFYILHNATDKVLLIRQTLSLSDLAALIGTISKTGADMCNQYY